MTVGGYSTEARAYSTEWSEKHWEGLSPTERYVTQELHRGRPYADIAKDWGAKEGTVTTHASNAASRIPGLPGLDPKEKLTNFFAAHLTGFTLSTEGHPTVPCPKAFPRST